MIRNARCDDERIAYEREYLKKADHRDSVSNFSFKNKNQFNRNISVRIFTNKKTNNSKCDKNATRRTSQTSST